jgi:hypothetical protein
MTLCQILIHATGAALSLAVIGITVYTAVSVIKEELRHDRR